MEKTRISGILRNSIGVSNVSGKITSVHSNWKNSNSKQVQTQDFIIK